MSRLTCNPIPTTSSCLFRFHFVRVTFSLHEFIRNLKHLSYSTSVILILRKNLHLPIWRGTWGFAVLTPFFDAVLR